MNEALAVTTRANARRQEELSAAHERNEEASGVQQCALDNEVMESQPDSQERQESVPGKEAEVPRAEIVRSEFDEQIFTDVKERVRYTRKQKRRQREYFAVARERGELESPLDLNAGDLRKRCMARGCAEGEMVGGTKCVMLEPCLGECVRCMLLQVEALE